MTQTNELGETRTVRFRQHPAMIIANIRSQAGTLSKAVLEAVMNSVDSGSTRIDISVSNDTITITDDGRGFDSMETIENHFSTVGTPHSAGDATFGRFRIGRLQLLGWGANTWRSGPFRMEVDIANRGLSHDIFDHEPPIKGCTIRIALYDELPHGHLVWLAQSIRRATAYLSIPVAINGTASNHAPSEHEFPDHDDLAWYMPMTKDRLNIYNQGVFVAAIHEYDTPFTGTIVTKTAIPLNAARNDPIRTSHEWRRILAEATRIWEKFDEKKTSGKTGRKRTIRNQKDRNRYIRLLLEGKNSWSDALANNHEIFTAYPFSETSTDIGYGLARLSGSLFGQVGACSTWRQSRTLSVSRAAVPLSESTPMQWNVPNMDALQKLLVTRIRREADEIGATTKPGLKLTAVADKIAATTFSDYETVIEKATSSRLALTRKDLTAKQNSIMDETDAIMEMVADALGLPPRPTHPAISPVIPVWSDENGLHLSMFGEETTGLTAATIFDIISASVFAVRNPGIDSTKQEPDRDRDAEITTIMSRLDLSKSVMLEINKRRFEERIASTKSSGTAPLQNVADFDKALTLRDQD